METRSSTKERIIKGTAVALLGCLGALGISACSESKGPIATSALRQDDLMGIDVTYVAPGQAKNVLALDLQAPETQIVIEKTPDIIDYKFAYAPKDPLATVITDIPARYNAHVRAKGTYTLADDTACDIYNLEPGTAKVGAIALGGQNESVYIAWPTTNGEALSQIEVCQHQNIEPEGGIILFAE